jgi:hypothetical protein
LSRVESSIAPIFQSLRNEKLGLNLKK